MVTRNLICANCCMHHKHEDLLLGSTLLGQLWPLDVPAVAATLTAALPTLTDSAASPPPTGGTSVVTLPRWGHVQIKH